MKGKEFAKLLEVSAEFASDERCKSWHSVSAIFEAVPDNSVVAICSVVSGVRMRPNVNGSRLQEMLDLLHKLRTLLGLAGAKKAVISDLQHVENTLSTYGECSTEEFSEAAIRQLRESVVAGQRPTSTRSDELVASYVGRLEESLNDAAKFAEIFEELKNDKAIKLAEAKKISRAFAKETAKSRKDAMDHIWGRHSALMGSRARQQANTGRTAA